jgi:hypothetical protein
VNLRGERPKGNHACAVLHRQLGEPWPHTVRIASTAVILAVRRRHARPDFRRI